MAKVTHISGAPFPSGEVIERDRHFLLYDDGSVTLTQHGVHLWGPLFRQAGLDITELSRIDQLTAWLQRTGDSVSDEVLQSLHQHHNREDWEAVALIIGGGDLDKARDLIEKGEQRRNLAPVD